MSNDQNLANLKNFYIINKNYIKEERRIPKMICAWKDTMEFTLYSAQRNMVQFSQEFEQKFWQWILII